METALFLLASVALSVVVVCALLLVAVAYALHHAASSITPDTLKNDPGPGRHEEVSRASLVPSIPLSQIRGCRFCRSVRRALDRAFRVAHTRS